MTDICPTTGKPQLTAAAAHEQVRHSRRGFVACRCRACGHWHVNSPTFLSRQIRHAAARARDRRREPLLEDD